MTHFKHALGVVMDKDLNLHYVLECKHTLPVTIWRYVNYSERVPITEDILLHCSRNCATSATVSSSTRARWNSASAKSRARSSASFVLTAFSARACASPMRSSLVRSTSSPLSLRRCYGAGCEWG